MPLCTRYPISLTPRTPSYERSAWLQEGPQMKGASGAYRSRRPRPELLAHDHHAVRFFGRRHRPDLHGLPCHGVSSACRAALALPRHTAHSPRITPARDTEEKSASIRPVSTTSWCSGGSSRNGSPKYPCSQKIPDRPCTVFQRWWKTDAKPLRPYPVQAPGVRNALERVLARVNPGADVESTMSDNCSVASSRVAE